MRSQRQLKVGEEIRHALSMMFQRGDVPWPVGYNPPMITLSEVQVSPDLRNATAYFTVLDDAYGPETARILNSVVGAFRHHVAKTVRLRYVPKLVFKHDTSFAYATNIEKILHDPKVARDIQAASQESALEQADDDNR